MVKKLYYCLICLGLVACAETKDKYRDIKHLEMPPVLAIDRANSTTYASSATSAAATKADDAVTATAARQSDKPSNSELSKLILLGGSEQKPVLQLKTRFERAWDLVAHGLRLAEIEVIESNRSSGVFKVNYVANGEGKSRGVLSSMTSFFTDKFSDTEYTLTVDKDQKITGVHAAKVNPDAENPDAFNNDDSASLIKLLHKTIIADLEK